ncbi:TOMM precursor leader peptide-binding protein [Streptomyces sp. SID8352]|uniref:TOMM precursor leader peptide-binding protein n=1 Tax=Streptomyces sp. SID8352 TaxID=2690338 RepID=UPI0013721705|nr:TOMM precursor leader peptide-binding protein [Streptomyces sp. SID8352]MYU23172.1 TOMM precursor leader peptide-binding protein [Streptomyces sp. SID8352]
MTADLASATGTGGRSPGDRAVPGRTGTAPEARGAAPAVAPRAVTPSVVAADTDGPGAARREACRLFAGDLRRALAELPAAPGGHRLPDVTVAALGVRDAFTAPAAAERAARTTLPVHLYGRQVIVGPRPAPGRPGCGGCLSRRWQGVRSVGLREGLELRGGTRESGPWPYRSPFAAQAVAALIARLGTAPPEDGGPFPDVWLVDLDNLTVRHHPLVPEPDCPGCGEPEPVTAESAALVLRPAPKYRPGVSRVRPVAAYRLPVDAFANPHWGAVGPSVVCDVTSPTTSATVGCFSSRSGEYLRETFWGGHADTYHDSTRIGVLEGLERFAGMRARGRDLTLTAALDDLGPDAVDPRETGLYTDAFHRDNPWVPPFSPSRPIPWVWGWSLRDGRPRPVPEVLAFYHKPGIEHRFVQESSNGCASGGSPEEAVLGGLMEVLERDAFLLAWHGMQPLPEIDPATSADPHTRVMVDRMAMYGYRARFFDTRITFPVPVVTGVAERFDGGPARMCFGAGAALDPEAALAAALCEIATDSVQLLQRFRRDEAAYRGMAEDFGRITSLHDHPLVYAVPEMGRHADFLLRRPSPPAPVAVSGLRWERADGSGPDIRDDLLCAVEAVTGAGFDVVVVDQTTPEQRALGLSTVKVLVPGLLPLDFGWTRQRARHMPRTRTALREAGLRPDDLTAAGLNPGPHPFP